MSLQFSKLNFKAKNQASTLSIHDPFAQGSFKQNIENQIQKERNDHILQLFADLPLDEDEKRFLDND
jgi:hypothetical protein